MCYYTKAPYEEVGGKKQSFHIAEWSSPVARRAHNPKVVGSNPASATNKNTPKSTDFEVFFCFSELFQDNSLSAKT